MLGVVWERKTQVNSKPLAGNTSNVYKEQTGLREVMLFVRVDVYTESSRVSVWVK